jgi:hypothetical protein
VSIRIESIEEPLLESRPSLALWLRLLARAEAMGFLSQELAEPIDLDRRTLRAFLQTLMEQNVALAQATLLFQAVSRSQVDHEEVESALKATISAIDASPRPEGEWQPAREVLGDELLAQLVSVSPASLRRYASGARKTPDDAAWRLHVVARLLAALSGSYNDYGIRRWFVRPRTALDGVTPAEVLREAETEDDPRLRKVVALAEQLTGSLSAT